jgi:hypothetical protein
MRKPIPNKTEIGCRMECHLPKAFKLHKAVRCIYDDAHRLKWEQNMEVYEKKERVPDSNGLIYELYTLGKKLFGASARDFLEKGIMLWDGTRFWCYTSSICQLNEKGELIESNDRLPEGVVRSASIYSLTMMTRETEEKKNIGKIKFVSVQSSDNKVSVPAIIFDPAVAKSMKQWVE